MYDYSRGTGYTASRTGIAVGEQPAVLGKVLGLLGFAFLFTAGGAVIGRTLPSSDRAPSTSSCDWGVTCSNDHSPYGGENNRSPSE